MTYIAIIEDEEKYRDMLVEFIKKFEKEESEACNIKCFKNGMEFLGDYKPVYDVVFMDIEMPLMNGMEIAGHLRKIDKEVKLIFVTKMAQFAINGYEVDALDFIVKPVSYYNFSVKLKKVLQSKNKNVAQTIVVKQGDLIRRINIADIIYLEIRDHQLIYHTTQDEVTLRGSLNEREKSLSQFNFVRCNNCYLVNLLKIIQVKGNVIKMDNSDELTISRSYHKKFLVAFSEFLGSQS